MLEEVELCISYTSTARGAVQDTLPYLRDICRIYDYESYLDRQAGLYIADIGMALYGKLPCIIFATEDWHTRPATIFELECMKSNSSKKLVFDYYGNFAETVAARVLSNVEFAAFDRSGAVAIGGVRDWVFDLARD